MGRQRRQVQDLLDYMQSVSLALLLLRQLDVTEVEAASLDTAGAGAALAAAPVGSAEGWRWLARIVRHLGAVAEARDDPRLVIIQALRREVQARADRAAFARQNGGQHSDDEG